MIIRATQIKNSFGRYIKLLDKEDIIVIKNGTPVARMIKYECWDEGGRASEKTVAYRYGRKNMSYEKIFPGVRKIIAITDRKC